MAQFWEFFTFELKLRAKSLSTYVYFALFFSLAFMAMAVDDFFTTGNDKVFLNGPSSTSILYIIFSFFGCIIIAAIFGTSILRDFQRDTYQIIFTKPITKFAYLGGRWLGSFITTVCIFFGLVLGEATGTFAPWADHARIGHGAFHWYLHAFFLITVVQIFFLGSLFFTIAALTRKLFVVYLQGVVFFVVYLTINAIFSSTRSLEHFWSAIFDPVGLRMFDAVTRYWTPVEQNTLQLPWSGVVLYNRLVWTAIGAISLFVVYTLFPLSVETLTSVSQGRRAARERENDASTAKAVRSLVAKRLPVVHQVFNVTTTFEQFLSLTRIRVKNIFTELPFWAIFAVIVMYALLRGHFAGHVDDATLYPVTFLMLDAVRGQSFVLLIVVATLYSGELVWRERDTHFDGIHDALPMRESTDWLSKLAALAVIELALLTVVMFCGILSQTFAGYFRFELLQYFKELYIVVFPQILIYTFLALFLQTVLKNKFIGHAIVIGSFVLLGVLQAHGWENTLYLFGNTPNYIYSDMNGYGHFAPALFWSITYWLAIAAILAVISIGLAVRGTDDGLASRLRHLRHRAPRLAPAGILFLLIAIGSGVWYFYNTHVLNEFLSAPQQRDIQANYERDFKKYQYLPQPKIIAVDANIDIFPERRSFSSTGHFVLQNKTPSPISQIHVVDTQQSVSNIQFDRPFHKVSTIKRDLYTIYALDQPLAPGEKMNMNFNVGYTSHGFRDGGERPELAYSGTFFDSGYFPTIGYDSGFELTDARRRREQHLAPVQDLPQRGDPLGSRTNLFTKDSDWITYSTVVSTSDHDSEGKPQVAIAPGYLQRDWHQDGRHYFAYSMGDVKILDFFAYVSARYDVKRDVYQGVNGPINIEVYYDPHHPYDVDDMIASSKAGLAYYEKNYSPFQFKQFRILEYPRYRNFAQSFPNTVPYTEPGFLGRVLDPQKDIDRTYFVTAHELAHQWWGHQLIGGAVAGSNMMSESLAEYSALRIAQHKYGDDQMHKFLKHELDGYLRGRAGEAHKEPPIVLVQREAYVWYQKGSLVLYGLSDFIGEDKLNLALHNFLMQYRYANATDNQDQPYPDTRQFVDALRAQTPPEYQYYITDAFENIVLYDNKALTATYVQTPDKKYKVTLTVQAKKFKSDGSGNETPMPLADYVDIGVFSGKKDHEKALYLKKEKITQEKNTFEIIVDELPTRAGIDPINKLIDRIPDDNTIDVTKP
ncbi:M1 family aminopeptidase [Granulicella sp. L46]|uniref:ABC transporter permease/M1 family aminopeptidase n=1 Tax=Granulicella sp. L46 TaxID=1641865 RepID=UPI00131E941C|nr:M1 family aminopeptidase [Granulicella sp. L46]